MADEVCERAHVQEPLSVTVLSPLSGSSTRAWFSPTPDEDGIEQLVQLLRRNNRHAMLKQERHTAALSESPSGIVPTPASPSPPELSGWKGLYRRIIERLGVESIMEVGAGRGRILQAFPDCRRRIAVDVADDWLKEFQAAGIEFLRLDLDRDDLPQLQPVEISICSDVFEHLVHPARALRFLRVATSPAGLLISHVPNEFRLRRTLRIMLGLREATPTHPGFSEHNNPHLRRFTKIGFRRFLETEFRYNLFISDLRYGRTARFLRRLGLSVPYALEGGPTFLSTSSEATYLELQRLKGALTVEYR